MSARSGSEPTGTITRALNGPGGHPLQRDALAERIYQELRRLAARHLAREDRGLTLGPTALVHEVYLRLDRLERIEYRDRGHFFALASRVARQVLIDFARRRSAEKRSAPRVALEAVAEPGDEPSPRLLRLDRALTALEAREPLWAKVVEMRFFGGLTLEETARALEISPTSAKRYWSRARAWLRAEMAD